MEEKTETEKTETEKPETEKPEAKKAQSTATVITAAQADELCKIHNLKTHGDLIKNAEAGGTNLEIDG